MALLAGRVAIITGAASGIGAASVRSFVKQGARVLAVDRDGERLAAEYGGVDGVDTCVCDIGAANAPSAIIDQALDRFGHIDILFNNAGISGEAPKDVPFGRYRIRDTPDDFWRDVLEINVNAAFRLTKAALPSLRNSVAGRVIGSSSTVARFTDVGLSAYSTSKAALEAFLRTVAVEEGKHGITVNWLQPGAIYTAMTRHAFDRADLTAPIIQRTALRRLGEASDVARVALFLASDLSAYVTGQGIAIDGGLFLRA
jgi:3-oxoacyl-[acyl-carrier protein] reductase